MQWHGLSKIERAAKTLSSRGGFFTGEELLALRRMSRAGFTTKAAMRAIGFTKTECCFRSWCAKACIIFRREHGRPRS